ncbi:Golgi apyrase [Puttea exsequens]|nr:Golgi apyrase [Puttea exsequens]
MPFDRSEQWRYGIIFDAGSSGTRLHIYRWLNGDAARQAASPKQLLSLPALETKSKWTKKTHPGISTFAEKIDRVGPDHLQELLQKARKVIPDEVAQETPVFLLATAGMRLLPEAQRNSLLDEICSFTRANTNFLLPDCDVHIKVISGEVEGLYGWVAANYLLGAFDTPKDLAQAGNHHTYGFLDMGGASAQLAFAPNTTEAERHANDLKLMRMRTVDGTAAEYRVFTTTWLGFGVNEARKKYVGSLQEASAAMDSEILQDPCLPEGLTTTVKGDVFLPGSDTVNGHNSYLNGTGKFDECLMKTLPLLEKDHICEDDPCLLNGVHVPAIDFDVNRFVGVSEYWHTTHEIFEEGHKEKAYDFNTYQRRVNDFCSQDWEVISKGIDKHKWGKKVNEQTAVEICFKASWLINILHEGIGIPRYGLEDLPDERHNSTKKVLDNAKDKGFTATFQAVNKIDDTEVSWTLGKMVLYASSQISPSKDNTLPVGFGSNVPGIPKDFQYAGSTAVLNANKTVPSTKENHWNSNTFHPSSSRRIPGFILFLVIFAVAVYLLCGRKRRQQAYSRFAAPSRKGSVASPRRRGLFSGKIPFLRSGSSLGNYERVLEDGPSTHNFELSSIDDACDDLDTSDSSSSSHNASKNSGSAIPRSRSSLAVNESRERFENLGGGHGLGLSAGNVLDRSGLNGMTDSKDRLIGIAEGRRSRKASPTRPKGLSLCPLPER